jgi:hypothetical protein
MTCKLGFGRCLAQSDMIQKRSEELSVSAVMGFLTPMQLQDDAVG